MKYFIAKTVVFLMDPNHWLILSILAWVLVRRPVFRRRLLWISLIWLAVLTNGWFYKTVMRRWQIPPVALNQTYQTGILLAGISGESYHGVGMFGPAADRFIQTVKLYHSGKIQRVIITGGDGSLLQRGFKEAYFLRDEMKASGVPDSVIVVEANSRNTEENARFTRSICDSLQWKGPYVLISSAMHLRRAAALFQHQGMDVVLYPSNYEKVGKHTDWTDYVLPDFSLLSKWNLLLKEMIGYTANRFKGIG
jgi:uncharacterized SAM-binding protein YcdF (DUF218 family)